MSTKKMNPNELLMQIYFLSRFFIKASKKFNKGKIVKCIILQLLDKKPMTVRELADLFSTYHSFMSATVCMMERKGYVKKKASKDNRYNLITLTEDGKKLREKNRKKYCNVSDWYFAKLTENDMEQLSKLIAKITLTYPQDIGLQ